MCCRVVFVRFQTTHGMYVASVGAATQPPPTHTTLVLWPKIVEVVDVLESSDRKLPTS